MWRGHQGHRLNMRLRSIGCSADDKICVHLRCFAFSFFNFESCELPWLRSPRVVCSLFVTVCCYTGDGLTSLQWGCGWVILPLNWCAAIVVIADTVYYALIEMQENSCLSEVLACCGWAAQVLLEEWSKTRNCSQDVCVIMMMILFKLRLPFSVVETHKTITIWWFCSSCSVVETHEMILMMILFQLHLSCSVVETHMMIVIDDFVPVVSVL